MIWANHIATQKHQPNIYQTNTAEDVYGSFLHSHMLTILTYDGSPGPGNL